MKSNSWVSAATGLAAIALVAGCEWQSGGSAEHFSDRYNWVNFSGVYRGVNGGLLVTDYTALPGASDITNTTARQLVATGDGVTAIFTGVAGRGNIVPGTFVVEAGDMYWLDNGSGTLVASGLGAINGRIVYDTGAWMVRGVVPAGVKVVIRYASTTDATQTGTNRPGSGASGIRIYSFSLTQEGNRITIVDNNGSVYTGEFGSITTNTGANRTTALNEQTTILSGDAVIAQFNVKGVSAAGKNVRITGVLQGTAVVNVDQITGVSTLTLSDRRMTGTWIEEKGRTGDINGAAD